MKMLLEITIKTFERCARNTVNVDKVKTTRHSLSFNRHLALIKIKLQRLIVVPPARNDLFSSHGRIFSLAASSEGSELEFCTGF